MKVPDLIVFDMDGVLIDVAASYREAVRKTARLFFSGARGFGELPDPLFPLPDLAALKQTGGLNNDWDLTALALGLLLSAVETDGGPTRAADDLPHAEAVRRCDVSGLGRFLRDTPRPLAALLARHGRRSDPLVSRCYRGDVGTGNVIKRIFQEVYLGPALFRSHYGLEPEFWRQEGLIHQETLLIDPALLEELARDHVLAVATGRPAAEADFPLDRFGLREYFQAIVTLDDSTREEERIFCRSGRRVSLKKPDPYMLDRVPALVGGTFGRCYYLGDMPDDMEAARASKTGYQGVGILVSSAEPEVLRRELAAAGAVHIIDDYAALPRILA